MDQAEVRELADWITEVARKQGALQIVMRRVADAIDLIEPGAIDRIYAPVRPPHNSANTEAISLLNELIADLRGD